MWWQVQSGAHLEERVCTLASCNTAGGRVSCAFCCACNGNAFSFDAMAMGATAIATQCLQLVVERGKHRREECVCV